jgi:hypothetical protein
VKDQLAATGCRVDVLCQGFKAYALLGKISNSIDKVAKRASKPVKAPDNKCVTCSKVAESLSKSLFGKGEG